MADSEGLIMIGCSARGQRKKKLDSKGENHPLFTAKERVVTRFLISLVCDDSSEANLGASKFIILRRGRSLLMNQLFTLFTLTIHTVTQSKQCKPAFTLFTFDDSSK